MTVSTAADHWNEITWPLLQELKARHGAYPESVELVRYRSEADLRRLNPHWTGSLKEHRRYLAKTAKRLAALNIAVEWAYADPAATIRDQAVAAAYQEADRDPYRLVLSIGKPVKGEPGKSTIAWAMLGLPKPRVLDRGRAYRSR